MRKNTGMAYKRRMRNAKKQREKAEILRCLKRNYCGYLPFDEYIETDPYMKEYLKKAGRFAKISYHGGPYPFCHGSLKRDIRAAHSALFRYDDAELGNDVVNRSEARKVKIRWY